MDLPHRRQAREPPHRGRVRPQPERPRKPRRPPRRHGGGHVGHRPPLPRPGERAEVQGAVPQRGLPSRLRRGLPGALPLPLRPRLPEPLPRRARHQLLARRVRSRARPADARDAGRGRGPRGGHLPPPRVSAGGRLRDGARRAEGRDGARRHAAPAVPRLPQRHGREVRLQPARLGARLSPGAYEQPAGRPRGGHPGARLRPPERTPRAREPPPPPRPRGRIARAPPLLRFSRPVRRLRRPDPQARLGPEGRGRHALPHRLPGRLPGHGPRGAEGRGHLRLPDLSLRRTDRLLRPPGRRVRVLGQPRRPRQGEGHPLLRLLAGPHDDPHHPPARVRERTLLRARTGRRMARRARTRLRARALPGRGTGRRGGPREGRPGGRFWADAPVSAALPRWAGARGCVRTAAPRPRRRTTGVRGRRRRASSTRT